MTTVLFAGGGTGGHLMPALAIADEMVRLNPMIQPFFVGSERGVEAAVLPQRPWRYELLPFEPIRRREWWKNVALPVRLYRVLAGVRSILRREEPALVVGTGGYVAGPVVWAAANRGLHTALQEQNAFPGLATRWLARRVEQIHLGFPEAARYLRPGRRTEVLVTGNPIQPPPEPRPPRDAAKKRAGFAEGRSLVLVMGGSQGALGINRAVAAALEGGGWPEGVQLWWQTGAGTYAQFERLAQPGRVRLEPFIDPVRDAYAAADLVLIRAGAMTVAEVFAWGLPAILVPLPTAAAGHQLANAQALAREGSAVLLEQRDLTGRTRSSMVRTTLSDPARMAQLATAAERRALPHAGREIASRMLGLVSKS